MNRIEFMTELEVLLYDISKDEREEALRFYESYFDEAGSKNEQVILNELKSPSNVANMIKADLGINTTPFGQYTETGYHDERFEDHKNPSVVNPPEEEVASSWIQRFINWIKKLSPIQLVLMIILLVLIVIPTVVPAFFSIIGTLFGVVVTIVGALAGLLIAAFALAITGVILLVVGFVLLFTIPAVGAIMLGAGCILLALGLVASVGMIKLCKFVYPRMFRFFIDVCSIPFKKRGQEA